MTDAKRRWFQPLLIVIVLVVCVWGMLQLMQSRVKPAKQKPQAVTQAEPVAINKIQRGSYPVVVSGWGLVSAKTQHRLIARVSGDIETQADALFSVFCCYFSLGNVVHCGHRIQLIAQGWPKKTVWRPYVIMR